MRNASVRRRSYRSALPDKQKLLYDLETGRPYLLVTVSVGRGLRGARAREDRRAGTTRYARFPDLVRTMGLAKMKRVFALAVALAVPPPLHAGETPAGGTARARPANPLAAQRLEDLTVTRERPLFSPTRRPPPRAEASEPPPVAVRPPLVEKVEAPEGPPFDLIGSVVGEANNYVLLRNRVTNNVSRLREGDEQEGWRIGAISLRSVVLERNGRVENLEFADPTTSAAAHVPQLAGPSDGDQPPQDVAPFGSRRSNLLRTPP